MACHERAFGLPIRQGEGESNGGEGGIRSRRTRARQGFSRDRNRQNPPDPLEMPVSGTRQVQPETPQP
jgi:hypothetical protein